jgi:hypothetical protein
VVFIVDVMSIVNQLQAQWNNDNNSTTTRTTYRQWAHRHPLLDPTSSPAELATRIYKADPVTANSLVAVLLIETRNGDRLARQTCLHAFIPLIMSTIKRSHANQYGRASDDFVSDMIVASIDIIDRIATEYSESMQWPITVFASRLQHRAQRTRTRQTDYENHISPHGIDNERFTPLIAPAPSVDSGTELINFLAAAVRRNAISADDARMVGARALLDIPVTANATSLRIGARGMQKRHSNMIARLREASTEITDTMVA